MKLLCVQVHALKINQSGIEGFSRGKGKRNRKERKRVKGKREAKGEGEEESTKNIMWKEREEI